MNYFEIFNKVLMELNYRAVSSFENIYKTEHKKVLDLINRVNNEVLATYTWPFLERCTFIDVLEGENVYKLPFKGNIKAVYRDRKRVLYTAEAENLLSGEIERDYYSVARNCFILPKAARAGRYKIIYESRNYALSENNEFKEKLTEKGDISVLPMPFAEHILVYGTCLKVKANPSYPKFGFWNTMYVQAIGNLLQKSPQSNESGPFINLD